MTTSLTSKGQVTIPKHIRDQLALATGTQIDFAVDASGHVVLRPIKAKSRASAKADRFERALGSATIKWKTTDELMLLLRGDEP